MRNQLKFIILILAVSLNGQNSDNEQFCSRIKTNISYQELRQVSSNQASYDVKFYDLFIQIFSDTETINGKVTVVFESMVDGLESIELDLISGLEVTEVLDLHDTPTDFTHSNNSLIISLPLTLAEGESSSATILYNGNPASSGFGSFGFDKHDGEDMIWSLSEPYGARDWWPCKDTPTDKADSVDIHIKVPMRMTAASNGLLDSVENEGLWKTYHWKERYPIATYLISVAIYPYQVFYDWYEYNDSDSMRLDFYIYPDSYEDVQPNYLLTKDMMAGFAARFGEYPFINEKYGHAEFVWGGGMEHQTLSSMGGHSQRLIAHELAHQWWGDLITCANFHHIWLNEGFATYSQAIWYEIRDGNIASLHEEMWNKRYLGSGSIFVEDTTSTSTIFSGSLSYNKAAWVLHMLRNVVGDSLFFSGLREYRDRFSFSSTVTEDFREVMEDVTGKNLIAFFDQWIYGTYYPVYSLYYEQHSESLDINIAQASTAGTIFEMPIDLKIICTDTTIYKRVNNYLEQQEYSLKIPPNKTVTSVELDPDNWILKTVVYLDTLDIAIPSIPTEFIVHPAYPNPFNSGTTIRYNLDRTGETSINIYNILGEAVLKKNLYKEKGLNQFIWQGTDLSGNLAPSGIYYVQINNINHSETIKVLLLR